MSHALTRRFLPTDQDGYARPKYQEALFKILERFRGFGYETWSHTPGGPRTRAVIELDRNVDRDEGIRLGEAFDNFVNTELGPDLVRLDKSVYRREQPVYAPGVSAKTFVFSGLPIQVDDFLVKYAPLVAPVQSNQGQSASQSALPKELTVDEIELIKDLRSALLHIRADDRDQWIRMGMALRTLDDVGRGLWLAWSATSSKFDPVDAGRVWDSLTPTTIDHKSVFAEAQRHGWLNPMHHLAVSIHSDVVDIWEAPEKLPSPLMPVEPLDIFVLPTPFQNAITDIAERMSAPPDYVASTMLCAAGIVIGNRVGICPKRFDDSWVVYPGFWGGIIGPPGTLKTPAMSAALAPVRQIEDNEYQQYVMAMKRYEPVFAKYEKDLKDYKAGKITIFPIEPTRPKRPRLIVNDTTYQALGVIVGDNPGGVLVFGDELTGLLETLDACGQEAARGFYLTGWGGQGSYAFDRVGRESIALKNFLISVFGGFQPDRIKQYVQQASGGGSKNDGLLQRFQLLVWPDADTGVTLVDRVPDKVALLTMTHAFLRLRSLAIGGQIAPESQQVPSWRRLHFTDAAQVQFDLWFVKNEELVRGSRLSNSLAAHLSKYRSLVPGLALLFHLIENCGGDVCYDCTLRAMAFALYLKNHARRVYASIHHYDAAPAKTLAEHLVKGDLQNGFTARTIYTKGWAGLRKETTKPALDLLVELNWLRVESGKGPGRPTDTYLINPSIGSHLL